MHSFYTLLEKWLYTQLSYSSKQCNFTLCTCKIAMHFVSNINRGYTFSKAPHPCTTLLFAGVEECIEEFRAQQQMLEERGDKNRFTAPLAPFQHPFTGQPFTNLDVFDTEKLGYDVAVRGTVKHCVALCRVRSWYYVGGGTVWHCRGGKSGTTNDFFVSARMRKFENVRIRHCFSVYNVNVLETTSPISCTQHTM